MSINADVTLKRLVYEISTWANARGMIEAFGYGKYLETFAADETRKYPVFVVNCPNYNQDRWYFNYQIEIICLEWVFDDRGNRVPAASDTAQIIADFENTIRESNRWQSFSRIDTPFNSTKVDEYGADKADGWVATFTLKVKKQSGICDLTALMPEYDFENGPSPLQCQPVSIYEDDIFIESVASGGRFDYSTACDDSTVTVNGNLFGTIASGATGEVPVEYENGDPVGVITAGIVVVPNPVELIRIYNPPAYSGAADRGQDYDTYWRMLNNIGNYTQPMTGVAMRLEWGKYYLLHSSITIGNVFGNLQRWTGTTGGYLDWDTWYSSGKVTENYYDVNDVLTTRVLAFPDGLAVDHWIGGVVEINVTTFQDSWYDWLTLGAVKTIGSFTGFYLMSVPEMVTFGTWGDIILPYQSSPLFAWNNGAKLTADSYPASGANNAMIMQSYAHMTSAPKGNNNKAVFYKPIDINTIFG